MSARRMKMAARGPPVQQSRQLGGTATHASSPPSPTTTTTTTSPSPLSKCSLYWSETSKLEAVLAALWLHCRQQQQGQQLQYQQLPLHDVERILRQSYYGTNNNNSFSASASSFKQLSPDMAPLLVAILVAAQATSETTTATPLCALVEEEKGNKKWMLQIQMPSTSSSALSFSKFLKQCQWLAQLEGDAKDKHPDIWALVERVEAQVTSCTIKELQTTPLPKVATGATVAVASAASTLVQSMLVQNHNNNDQINKNGNSFEANTKSTTVEDRVHARAKAKRDRGTRKSSLEDMTTNEGLTKEELWPWASLLWSHARTIQQRQQPALQRHEWNATRRTLLAGSSMGTTNIDKTSKNTVVTMTLHDVVTLFCQQQQRSSNNKATSLSRKQAVQYVHQLVDFLPEWLYLQPRSKQTTAAATTTTLWMFHSKNKNVPSMDRAWLEKRMGRGVTASASSCVLQKSKTNKDEGTAKLFQKKNQKRVANRDDNKNSNVVVSASSNESSKAVVAAKKRKKDKSDDEPSSQSSSKVRRSLFFSGPQPFAKSHHAVGAEGETKKCNDDDNENATDLKRKANDEDTHDDNDQESPSSPLPPHKRAKPSPKKGKVSPLRINHHLILSDADHHGGERLVPRMHDSPRGLKGLFQQMKEGNRI